MRDTRPVSRADWDAAVRRAVRVRLATRYRRRELGHQLADRRNSQVRQQIIDAANGSSKI